MTPEMQAEVRRQYEQAFDAGVSACIRVLESMAHEWASGPRPLSILVRPADIKAYTARILAASLPRLKLGSPSQTKTS